jgi:hypothetical protein
MKLRKLFRPYPDRTPTQMRNEAEMDEEQDCRNNDGIDQTDAERSDDDEKPQKYGNQDDNDAQRDLARPPCDLKRTRGGW